MASKPGSRLVSGTTKVTTAQTAVQLSSPKLEGSCIGVWVSGDPANTAGAAVGDKNVTAKAATLGNFKGISLPKGGAPIFIEISDPNELWFDAEKSGDYVMWTAVLA